MKLKQNIKRLIAMVLSVVLCMSMATVALAAETVSIDTEDEISVILTKINAEYGTNIHVLSEAELAAYGLTKTAPKNLTDSELVDLEETLRYIAEVKIPQFEHNTQEAIAVVNSLGIDTDIMEMPSFGETSVLSTTSDAVIATKAIDYATAGAKAYITNDAYGNTVWGTIVSAYCYTNMYQSTWFLAPNPSVTYIDARRSLYWTGTGDYCAYIDGTQYYLYSGTQYASMYVGNYA